MASKRRVLVYGGRGALGSVCVKHFRSKDFWVGSVDLTENEEANVNVVVKAQSWQEQEQEITSSMAKILGEEKVDGIFCVAGGWAGGNAASKTFVKSADAMWKQSVWTSVIASSLATKYLKEGGVLTLAGAQPALQGTPGMIGYGMAKAAVHHLTKSLSAENSGLPPNSVTFATLPITLDTPMNRKWMSNADKSTWTPLEFIADLFLKWTEGVERPGNGSLVQFITKGGETELVIT